MTQAQYTPTLSAASTTGSIDASSFLVARDRDHPNAKVPTRGSAEAAGYDLYASERITLPRRGRAVVQTGIRMQIPQGCYGRVAPRSGLAVKHGIDTGAGVVDSDYRGLLGVVLFNTSDEDFTVNVGDRIAQMILERIATPEVVEVESLDETVRGAGGFGHTGGFGVKASPSSS
ncbi:unnamed protein product [Parajaminaea phylloscopi]